MTSTIAGSSSMIMILAISQGGEYFNFEKKKEESGKTKECQVTLPSSMIHGTWPTKLRICSVNGGRDPERYSDHISQKILAYFSELMFAPQRPRRIDRHHLQGFLRR